MSDPDPGYLEALAFVAELLPQLARDEAERPVRPPLPIPAAEALIPALEPEGRPLAEVFAALSALAEAAPLTTTPPFFNQLFSGRDPAAVAADFIASHLNNSMYTYKAAGALIMAERQLLDHMVEIAGFGQGEGSFTSGGSLSNLLAIALARNEAVARYGRGASLAIYTSSENHYSIPKAAVLLGLGRESVRSIETDARGRMRVAALAEAITRDRALGLTPMMINATAATTVMGAFDPIAEIAALGREQGLWVHVDGAWGGSLLLVERYREREFAGLERCDSLTWDAHKLMGVPLTCSALLVREPGVLARHLGEDAHYLFQTHGPALNPGLRSIQCGRRNDALKLWAAWQHHGDRGYARRFETLLARRDRLVARIRREPALALSHEPESLNVCFEMPGVSPEALCAALNDQGRAVVGYGRVNGRDTIRLVITHLAQTDAVLDAFLDDLLELGAALAS